MDAIDVEEPTGLGVRDRTMLEALYSTAMRRGELVALRIDEVDLREGTVFIRLGKGKKDRVVPIGEPACAWIEKYLYTIRPNYLEFEDPGTLFLAKHGGGMDGKQLSGIVKRAIERAALDRFQDTHPNAACHLLRHACATHMLENGADIHYIQALLGHADLSTTEIYTRVSILKLKEVHAQTHPAGLTRTGTAVLDALPADDPPARACIQRERRLCGAGGPDSRRCRLRIIPGRSVECPRRHERAKRSADKISGQTAVLKANG